MKITEIIGMDKKNAKLLEKEGISNVKDLLTLTAYKIKKLAEKTGIQAKLIDTWQEIADLMRIDGVGPELSHVLNKIGIDSVKELAQRNAKNTLERIKKFVKDKSDIIQKIPTLVNVTNWIEQAKSLKIGKGKTKEKQESEEGGKYGPDYWNNKWEKEPIIYTGRALRGESYYKQIDVDVKAFIKKEDAILYHVIDQADLKRSKPNATALAIQKFVCDFLKYKYDEETSDCPEFWQFPFESIQSGIGDCEYRLHFASIAKMERF